MLLETPEAEAARVVAAEPAVRRVILFGSRARGAASPAADIDLAIDAPDADSATLARLREALERRRSLVGVDLLLLHQAPPDWRNRIERTGRILFERPA